MMRTYSCCICLLCPERARTRKVVCARERNLFFLSLRRAKGTPEFTQPQASGSVPKKQIARPQPWEHLSGPRFYPTLSAEKRNEERSYERPRLSVCAK